MTATMMTCGCAAQGVTGPDRKPVCIVHNCTEINEAPPSLEGRQSCCSYMYGPKGVHDVKPSSPELAFFVYRGPGSEHATDKCKCGYYRSAHDEHGRRGKCRGFTAVGPAQYDHHYCGCHGWD